MSEDYITDTDIDEMVAARFSQQLAEYEFNQSLKSFQNRMIQCCKDGNEEKFKKEFQYYDEYLKYGDSTLLEIITKSAEENNRDTWITWMQEQLKDCK